MPNNLPSAFFILQNVLLLFIVSTGFISFLEVPYFAKKMQLPEIIALFAIIPILLYYVYKYKQSVTDFLISFNIIDKSVIIYILTITIADFLGNHHHSLPTIMGYFYVSFIFFIFKFTYLRGVTEGVDFLPQVEKAIILLGVVQSCIGLFGWLIWYFGNIESNLIQMRVSYMYFDKVARVQAFTGDPNMLASILSVSIIFIINKIVRSSQKCIKDIFSLLVCIVGLLFTMSKAVLLLLVIVIYLYKFHLSIQKERVFLEKKILSISANVILILFLFITHFYVTSIAANPLTINKGGSFINEKPLFTSTNYAVYETSYSVNKKISFLLFERFPLSGVGLGKQETWCDVLKLEGKYPQSFACLDAHCTYTGTFSETCIIGGMAYILFIISFLYSIYFLNIKKYILKNKLLLGFCLVVLMAILEALTLENSTFRHHWICFGVLSGIFSYYNKPHTSV